MLAGKVVEKFEVNGKEVKIRYPRMRDAESYMELWNSLVDEGARINRQEKLDFKDEIDLLAEALKAIEKNEGIYLVAEIDGKLIGSGSVEKKKGAQAHQGYFGIMVKKDFRRKGIGTKLLENLLSEAKKELGIEIAWLTMFEDNKAAKNLYEKFGFKETGEIPAGLKVEEECKDEIIMYKDLR